MPRRTFSKPVIEEAETFTLPTSVHRRPQVPGITIDGAHSRDLDDAIWIEEKEHLTTLSVHIADVAELVQPGSLIDQEARSRIQTLYFRHNNTPMLPRCLSENKLSLLEHQLRPTITLEITLNQSAEIQNVEVYESQLSSHKRFTYEQADEALMDISRPDSNFLYRCWQWAEQLYQRRIQSKNFDGLTLPEGYYLDENGNLLSTDFTRYQSYLIIQEFMILANTAMAQWLVQNNIPAIYRNHTHRAIGPEQTHQFEALVNAQSEEDIRRILMGWLNPAEYGPEPHGHFALNLSAYCHFTSPIRRYPDLINHRMVKAHLMGQSYPSSSEDICELSQHIEATIQAQEEAHKTFYKAQQRKLYESQLQSPEIIAQLPSREFSLLLRFALEDQQGIKIKAEASTRLQSGNVTVEDLFVLLLLGDELQLQEQVLEHLEDHLYDAASIVSIALNQIEAWQSSAYVEVSQEPPFVTWLEILIDQQLWTTAKPGISMNKTGARHQSCLAWLKSMIEGTLVHPEHREAPPIPQPSVPKLPPVIHKLRQYKEGHNCLSLLMELCQGLQWPQAEFEIVEHEQGFHCECRLKVDDEVITGGGIASSKKTAKHRAARQIIEKLQVTLIQDESLVETC